MFIRKDKAYDGIRYDYYIEYIDDDAITKLVTYCPTESVQKILYEVLIQCNYYPYKEQ
jgi:hypothetical protein